MLEIVRPNIQTPPANDGVRSIAAARARQRLEEQIAKGAAAVEETLDKIERLVPTDYLIPSNVVRIQAAPNGVAATWPQANQPLEIHRHALGQLAERAAVPTKYVDTLMQEDAELLAHNLTRRYAGQEPKKYLARVVQGGLRGWLSASYRRLDAAPIIQAFFGQCHQFGAVPVDGVVTDTKVNVKTLLPKVFEPVHDEVLALGASLRTSDFGDGALSIQTFIVRLVCLNGMLADELLRRVHLGSRLDDLTWSRQTYSADHAE